MTNADCLVTNPMNPQHFAAALAREAARRLKTRFGLAVGVVGRDGFTIVLTTAEDTAALRRALHSTEQ